MTEKPEPQVGDIWYRFESHRYANLIGEDEFSSSLRLDENRFRVLKVTPKGVWLAPDYGRNDVFGRSKLDFSAFKRFVLLTAQKRFAQPTKEEALLSFLARKSRQLSILRNQVKDAETAQRMAQALLQKEKQTKELETI